MLQTAEVAITAAAVCLITLASNHVRQKGKVDDNSRGKDAETRSIAITATSASKQS